MPNKKKTESLPDTPVQFQIAKIETLQFAVLTDKVNDKDMQFQAGFGFGVDPESKIVRCSFEYTFLSEQEPVLKIETALQFAIEPGCYEQLIDKPDNWTIPKNFAIHAAITTVGTTRGILHEKTAGLLLNSYHLPTINVLDTVQDDVVIQKSIPGKAKKKALKH